LHVLSFQNASNSVLEHCTDAMVNPKRSNAFGALYAAYRTAKDLVKK
jgi:hypothetical protein